MGWINLSRKAGTGKCEGSLAAPADVAKSMEDAATSCPAALFRRRYAGRAAEENIPEMAGQKCIPFQLCWTVERSVGHEFPTFLEEARLALQHSSRWAPIQGWQGLSVLKGGYKKDGDRHFSRACCNATRGNDFKLKEGRFRLDRRKNFFTRRLVGHWHRLPRGVVDAPSLEVFKARLDGALSSLEGVSAHGRGIELWSLKVLSNPNHSIILWK